MNIGFDLDKIFINHPPLIPDWIIDTLYKKQSKNLEYRIPGTLEQQLRILSHTPFLRPLIKNNYQFVKNLSEKKTHTLFLVSSRFGFLKPRTQAVLKRYHFDKIFSRMFFNENNEQPHFFKSEVIQKMHMQLFIDDDLPLLQYLSKKYPKITFLWLTKNKNEKINSNIYAISKLSDITKFL